jgi:surface antigen
MTIIRLSRSVASCFVECSVMSSNDCLFPLAAGGLTAFTLVAALFVSSDFAFAGDKSQPQAGCSCPNSSDKSASKPKFAEFHKPLDESDEVAALESVQFALAEVADGSSYVWHRNNGRLSGIVKPTSSFKDGEGSVCRHAVVVFNSSDTTKKTEIVACRLATGVWQLEG